jgi:hypothetical protein
MAGIWRQLASDDGALTTEARSLYRRHANKGTRPPLTDVLKVLCSQIKLYSKIYIVIDALDELPEDQQIRKSFLAALRALDPAGNILITSRFIDTIAESLKGTQKLEISAESEDVRSYVHARIDQADRLSQFVQKEPALGTEIVSVVLKNADKMYKLLPKAYQRMNQVLPDSF